MGRYERAETIFSEMMMKLWGRRKRERLRVKIEKDGVKRIRSVLCVDQRKIV